MSNPAYVDRPPDTAISDALTDLALGLRWSFNHSAGQLWEQLDPELWEHCVWREIVECCMLCPALQRAGDLIRSRRTGRTERNGVKVG